MQTNNPDNPHDAALTVLLNNDLRVLIASDRDHGLPEHLRSDYEFCRLRGPNNSFTFWMSGREVTEQFFYQCLDARIAADALAEHDSNAKAKESQ